MEAKRGKGEDMLQMSGYEIEPQIKTKSMEKE